MSRVWKKYNSQELETILNSKLVKRAKLNDDLVEVLRVIESKGLTIIPETREFTGKYFLVVDKEQQ